MYLDMLRAVLDIGHVPLLKGGRFHKMDSNVFACMHIELYVYILCLFKVYVHAFIYTYIQSLVYTYSDIIMVVYKYVINMFACMYTHYA